MNVVSLFDGISCAKVALERQGFKIKNYYASEIDAHAIAVSLANHPEIKHVGGVQNVNKENFPHIFNSKIDLLIGGSPCQDLSIANINRKGLAGSRSGLFYEYVRILKKLKPRYFILENVASMSVESRAAITKELGVEPIMIDAGLVSAQLRRRLFWTNIPNVALPKDRGILLKDIIESGAVDRDKSYCIDASYYKGTSLENYLEKGRRQIVYVAGKKPYAIVPEATKKGYAIAEVGDSVDVSRIGSKTRRGRVGKKVKNLMTQNNIAVVTEYGIRLLTPKECERLQCLPDDYTLGVSNTQRYKALGNAFNTEVVSHILSYLPKE